MWELFYCYKKAPKKLSILFVNINNLRIFFKVFFRMKLIFYLSLLKFFNLTFFNFYYLALFFLKGENKRAFSLLGFIYFF